MDQVQLWHKPLIRNQMTRRVIGKGDDSGNTLLTHSSNNLVNIPKEISMKIRNSSKAVIMHNCNQARRKE